MKFITDNFTSNLWKISEPSSFYQKTGKPGIKVQSKITGNLFRSTIFSIDLSMRLNDTTGLLNYWKFLVLSSMVLHYLSRKSTRYDSSKMTSVLIQLRCFFSGYCFHFIKSSLYQFTIRSSLIVLFNFQRRIQLLQNQSFLVF